MSLDRVDIAGQRAKESAYTVSIWVKLVPPPMRPEQAPTDWPQGPPPMSERGGHDRVGPVTPPAA